MANLRVDKITSTETFETTGSVQFDGTNDGLTVSDHADFDLGTGDFTIEGWYYLENYNTSYQCLMDWRGGDGISGACPVVFRNNTGDYVYYYLDGARRIDNIAISYDTWFHLTICRSSGKTRLFIDGVERGSFIDSFDYVSSDILLGLAQSNASDIKGNISNYRVIRGKALYTSNFKPPMRELENIPGTVLLCCQSKTDTTLEKTSKTITVRGGAVASELTPGLLTPVPKAGAGSAITGSVEFTSTNDALVLSAGEDFAYGTGDFTIEAWIQPQGAASGETKAIFTQTQSGNDYVVFKVDSDKAIKATFGSTTVSGGTVEVGSWHHVAVTRASNTVKIFVNGVASSGTTVSTDFSDTTRNPTIGQYTHTYGNIEYYGFISNLRVVKGTALYTDDFIPPTRELKKVPGTVLLCCQDPDNPLTEATGKTITGYGDLYELDENVDLSTTASWVDGSTGAGSASESNGELTMQGNDASNRGIITKTVTEGIRPGVTYQMSFEVFDAATNGKTGLDSNDGTNDVLDDPTSTLDMVHFSGSDLDGNTGIFTVEGVATTHQVVMYFQEFGAAGTTEFKVRNITLRAVNADSTNINKASNFTPQVGDDRKVTFEGVTKINSDAYFYLPTGDTVTRDTRSSRGIFGGGQVGPTRVNSIGFITITTQGNSQDFGDLTVVRSDADACSSSTRGIFGGGRNPSLDPSRLNVMDFVTMASTGNALDFGDLSVQRRSPGSCSNSTRGVFAGGSNPTSSNLNSIDFVTIASTGDATDFGDLINERAKHKGCGSSIRAILFSPEAGEDIQFFNYASTGRAMSFGEMTPDTKGDSGAASDSTRALRFGGFTHPAGDIGNNISYITISSTGNEQEFGDLSATGSVRGTAMSNSIRAVQILNNNGANVNIMEYVTIQSTGNGKDFGDLTVANFNLGGSTSDSHGGLG